MEDTIYPVSAEAAKHAHIDKARYDEMYASSVADPNAFWMERMGAEVIPVKDGSRTLKDAINEAFRDWVTNMDNTHYVLGTACGPHPFPEMVAWLQSIIGVEAREQILQRTGKLPKRVYACVGGGSNAMGLFSGFMDDSEVELVGVEAWRHALRFR